MANYLQHGFNVYFTSVTFLRLLTADSNVQRPNGLSLPLECRTIRVSRVLTQKLARIGDPPVSLGPTAILKLYLFLPDRESKHVPILVGPTRVARPAHVCTGGEPTDESRLPLYRPTKSGTRQTVFVQHPTRYRTGKYISVPRKSRKRILNIQLAFVRSFVREIHRNRRMAGRHAIAARFVTV